MVAGISRFLEKFHGNVEVCGMKTTDGNLVHAIVLATNNGWRGPYILDLSGIQ